MALPLPSQTVVDSRLDKHRRGLPHVSPLIRLRRLSSLVAVVVVVVVVGNNYSTASIYIYVSELARTNINVRLPFSVAAESDSGPYHKAICGAASTPTTSDTRVHLNYILGKCERGASAGRPRPATHVDGSITAKQPGGRPALN